MDKLSLQEVKEKAILVALDLGLAQEQLDQSLEELALLADTAGAEVVATLQQKKQKPDNAFYIGRGKLEELISLAEHTAAELLIFNAELSPVQIRNIDRATGLKVVDRTALILDIFAKRALSSEGKLQVELAQLQYTLPRLIGLGQQLSKLGGGIGTRGPGETRLEVDRRVIRKRIGDLKRQITDIRRHRKLHRQRRQRRHCHVVSLVGYTNAGKSTLINALTGADLYTEDRLFATLDTNVKRGYLENNEEVLYIDTVGFIEKLPRQLITAFRATLEEIAASDLLLHVIDFSQPDYPERLKIVREHLDKIDPRHKEKEIIVFNKIDLAPEEAKSSALRRQYPEAVFVSAHSGSGLDTLKEKIYAFVSQNKVLVDLRLPYSEGRLLAKIQEEGTVEEEEYKEHYLQITARVHPKLAGQLKNFRTDLSADEEGEGGEEEE